MLILTEGEGTWLTDSEGNRYIDGNSSIWTNIHGHRHPAITKAIKDQLDKVAHTSYLGYGNPQASELAAKLCSYFPTGTLSRVFFSDDGSTAMEAALKIERQYRMQSNQPSRLNFIAFSDCYHGDTMGAASLGGVDAFFERFRNCGLSVTHVKNMGDLYSLDPETINSTAAVVIEPVVQGVNRVNVWPEGMLRELRSWTEQHGIHLILDEVMTGYGRTGHMFACIKEQVTPDYICSAKGLTGGYTPLAATLIKEHIYRAFLNEEDSSKDKTFYYGHSFTAHQVGCAAALASLQIFEDEHVFEEMPSLIKLMDNLAHQHQATNPYIGNIRQAGMVMGIDIINPKTGKAFDDSFAKARAACHAMRKYGLLTRPAMDAIMLMPPYCITEQELCLTFDAVSKGITDACSAG